MTLCPYQFFQDSDVQLKPTKMFLMMMFIIFFWGTSCHLLNGLILYGLKYNYLYIHCIFFIKTLCMYEANLLME